MRDADLVVSYLRQLAGHLAVLVAYDATQCVTADVSHPCDHLGGGLLVHEATRVDDLVHAFDQVLVQVRRDCLDQFDVALHTQPHVCFDDASVAYDLRHVHAEALAERLVELLVVPRLHASK